MNKNETYERIEILCKQKGISITEMCDEAKISRSIMSELKSGRTAALSIPTITKLADYFSVSTDYLATGTVAEGNSKAERGLSIVCEGPAKTVRIDGKKISGIAHLSLDLKPLEPPRVTITLIPERLDISGTEANISIHSVVEL